MTKTTDYTDVGNIISAIGSRNWVTIPQAAKALGFHHITVRKYVKSGILGSIQMGSRRVVTLEQLKTFKESGNRYSQAYSSEYEHTPILPDYEDLDDHD